MPQRVGQFITEAGEWSREKYGLELKHRLHFPSERSTELTTVHVQQQFIAIENGWSRHILVKGLGSNESIGLRSSFETASSAEKYARLDDVIRARTTGNGRAALRLDYVSEEVVDNTPFATNCIIRSDRKLLDVMPGFQLTRLPLRTDVMPIALAWKPTGELLVASLKGRVWSAKDTDGDHLEDQMQLVSDELAAPYGIFAQTITSMCFASMASFGCMIGTRTVLRIDTSWLHRAGATPTTITIGLLVYREISWETIT
jgi:hypothetical protein